MAVLVVVKPSVAGADPGFVAAAGGGDSFPNTGAELLIVDNGSGGSITVTIEGPGEDNFGVTHATAFDAGGSVPAGAVRVFGPFRTKRFNDANGRVQVAYSAVTSVTVAVVGSAHAGD